MKKKIFYEGHTDRQARPIEYITDKNGCMICISHSKTKDGHINVKRSGKSRLLHRYVYELTYGCIDNKNIVVRHKCDNPACFNPEHLEVGTHADNVMDRVSRNRSASGVRNGRAKLTEDDVRYIRKNISLSNGVLSKMFSVDSKAVYDIKRFKTWKNVI